jgi:hypothetical protein
MADHPPFENTVSYFNPSEVKYIIYFLKKPEGISKRGGVKTIE